MGAVWRLCLPRRRCSRRAHAVDESLERSTIRTDAEFDHEVIRRLAVDTEPAAVDTFDVVRVADKQQVLGVVGSALGTVLQMVRRAAAIRATGDAAAEPFPDRDRVSVP